MSKGALYHVVPWCGDAFVGRAPLFRERGGMSGQHIDWSDDQIVLAYGAQHPAEAHFGAAGRPSVS